MGEEHVFPHTCLLPGDFLFKLLFKLHWVQLFDTEPAVQESILFIPEEGRPLLFRGRFDAVQLCENSFEARVH